MFIIGVLPLAVAVLYYSIGLSEMGATTRRQEILNPLTMIIVDSSAGFVYFLPAIVGRKKRDAAGIAVWNLYLGWTIIGWIMALIWAFSK
jgi:hypothetical protein